MADLNRVILDVDLRSRENNSAHRTKDMDRERLIVRRGQPFSITLQCSEPPPPDHHLDLVLHLGETEAVEVEVQRQRGAGGRWWFNQQGAQEELLLTLHSPPDAVVGRYRLAVRLMSPDVGVVQETEESSFHLLFNPWCKGDAVYLPDESLLQEYVMNEDGVIYMGSWDSISSIPWNYGQFEERVMDVCFQVLDASNDALRSPKTALERRWDPVYVGRTVTAMVNSNGDSGVLAGQWTPPYSDGVAPHRWTGSVPILREWSRSGHRAVKYGQCWVFAGVACTVLRCLGIPTRLITNFTSAHDVDGNLSVDQLVNFDSSERQDSSWNFHCWVESWMTRQDLPEGNDGWQVLDPTPQELSDGEFRCGPCPVAAIKEGELGVEYDAAFVFAEVNADIIYWRLLPDGRRQKIRVDQRSVGRNISTKSVYDDSREDVTLLYKYPEGSEKEREVYEKAGRRVTEPTNERAEPARLKLSFKHAKPVFGTDFDVITEVKNDGDEDARVQLTVLAVAVTYNSLHLGECQKQSMNVTVPARQAHKQVLRMRYEDYARCISEHHVIRMKGLVEAQGENEPIMTVADILLSMPEVRIQVPGKAVVWKQTTAFISFINPLPVPLKEGVFTVEGAGLLTSTSIPVDSEISPGQTVSVRLSFYPRRTGVRKLLVDFDSDRLKDVKGVASVLVHKTSRNIPEMNGSYFLLN